GGLGLEDGEEPCLASARDGAQELGELLQLAKARPALRAAAELGRGRGSGRDRAGARSAEILEAELARQLHDRQRVDDPARDPTLHDRVAVLRRLCERI